MFNPLYLQFIIALLVIPTLLFGAIEDWKYRTFSKQLWKIPRTITGIITIGMYLLLLVTGNIVTIITLLVTSGILALLFYVLALRFGSGGDYRALIYLSLLTPSFAVLTIILSFIIGMVQGILTLLTEGTKGFFKRKVPWAVGICSAYIITVVYFIIVGF